MAWLQPVLISWALETAWIQPALMSCTVYEPKTCRFWAKPGPIGCP
jgi:hypothetical protein